MKILIALILSTLPFASFVQAFEINTKIGSSVSVTSGVSKYQASGTVKTISDSSRGIYSYDANILTVGSVVKHSTETVNVNQVGTTLSSGGYDTWYAGIEHGNIEIGGSVSVGGEHTVSHSNDYSVINTFGTDTTSTTQKLFGIWTVGSSNEVVLTNTSVQMNNYAMVDTTGSWISTSKYIK